MTDMRFESRLSLHTESFPEGLKGNLVAKVSLVVHDFTRTVVVRGVALVVYVQPASIQHAVVLLQQALRNVGSVLTCVYFFF